MGGAARKAAGATTYIATPEETEGPYWVEQQLNRSDLLVDPSDNSVQSGFPLVFTVAVSSFVDGAITPISRAIVDIWHCNALGIYSDEAAYNPGGGDGTVVTTGKSLCGVIRFSGHADRPHLLDVPYNQRTNARDTYNTTDSVYTGLDCLTSAEDGTETMFNITTTSAYASANYNIVLDLSSALTCNSSGGGTPPPGLPPM